MQISNNGRETQENDIQQLQIKEMPFSVGCTTIKWRRRFRI